jgi:hypothetical protein
VLLPLHLQRQKPAPSECGVRKLAPSDGWRLADGTSGSGTAGGGGRAGGCDRRRSSCVGGGPQ